MTRRARLDVDRSARPLTELVAHVMPGTLCGPGITQPDAIRSTDLCVLRDAAADAATEVLWHLEREGSAPAHVLAHAEALMRAAGALADD